MNKNSNIIVIGNEKGGVGKTTCSMHILVGLLYNGYKVVSIDVDTYQKSLTSYVENRIKYNENKKEKVPSTEHYVIEHSTEYDLQQKNFIDIIEKVKDDCDFILIDTPGSNTKISGLAHTYADIVLTPLNDSFVDLDVIAKIDGKTLEMTRPSIYSEMLWKQKLERAKRDRRTIDWIVLRNRISSTYNSNKKRMELALDNTANRLGFKISPGFSERVIFKELFGDGLTLLDLIRINKGKYFTSSHIAARQELRKVFNFLDKNINGCNLTLKM